MKFDDAFWRDHLIKAYAQAARSHDPSSQVGALLLNEGGSVISEGYNSFPKGIENSPENWSPENKHKYVVHAEVCSIVEAARRGYTTRATTMVLTWGPCLQCATVMVKAGIGRVVHHVDAIGQHERWAQSIYDAQEVLTNNGIEIIGIEGPLSPIVHINGIDWRP